MENEPSRPCRDADPERFFPPDSTRFLGDDLLVERERIANLCGDCPVRTQCLAGALLRGEAYGSWGGVSQPDYHIIRRVLREDQDRRQEAA
ncbi:WhiB family transcriptional regulator [Amycolatopsis thailandensis]|uniref:WhiB family transcriptional regulator n=1 Tax=Amycolatopsis thailandensis TaxID=589330 RepID=UPI00142D5140|nr:WhiB family transcriptional regulator [Amycolatopsis thailandensis]